MARTEGGRIEDCTAVILCGGESRRMGRDKAAAPFRGRPLWRHVHEAVAPLFAQVLFSVHAPRPDLPGPQVADAWAGRGPMIGIASALAASDTGWVFAIACDMPFVAADLVRLFAARRGDGHAVVAEAGGSIQPLPGFYARAALPAMQAAIERGERGLARLIARRLDAAILPEYGLRRVDAGLRSFKDFDTPWELVGNDGGLAGNALALGHVHRNHSGCG